MGNKELRRAGRYMQVQSENGLKTAKKRWHSQGDAIGGAIAKERKRNEIEEEEKINNSNSYSNSNGPPFSSSISVRKELLLSEALKLIQPTARWQAERQRAAAARSQFED